MAEQLDEESRPAGLLECTRGATAVTYVTVLGLVSFVGGVAYSQFNDTVRAAVVDEVRASETANGADTDGPVGSLYGEVAMAGAEELLVQGSAEMSKKAGSKAFASARSKVRGRGATAFNDPRAGGSRDGDQSPGSDTPPGPADPNGTPTNGTTPRGPNSPDGPSTTRGRTNGPIASNDSTSPTRRNSPSRTPNE